MAGESPELWNAVNALRDSLEVLAREQASGLARIDTHMAHQDAETARNSAALNGNGQEGLRARMQRVEEANVHRDTADAGRDSVLEQILERLTAIENAPKAVVETPVDVSPWRRFAVELTVIVGVAYSAWQQLKHLF